TDPDCPDGGDREDRRDQPDRDAPCRGGRGATKQSQRQDDPSVTRILVGQIPVSPAVMVTRPRRRRPRSQAMPRTIPRISTSTTTPRLTARPCPTSAAPVQ